MWLWTGSTHLLERFSRESHVLECVYRHLSSKTAVETISRWMQIRPVYADTLVSLLSNCILESIGARLHVKCWEQSLLILFLLCSPELNPPAFEIHPFTASRPFSSPAQRPTMRILILGSGGREHALVWKLSRSPAVKTIFLAPGNGGSCQEQKVINVDLTIADFPALVRFATENEVRPRFPRSSRP